MYLFNIVDFSVAVNEHTKMIISTVITIVFYNHFPKQFKYNVYYSATKKGVDNLWGQNANWKELAYQKCTFLLLLSIHTVPNWSYFFQLFWKKANLGVTYGSWQKSKSKINLPLLNMNLVKWIRFRGGDPKLKTSSYISLKFYLFHRRRQEMK